MTKTDCIITVASWEDRFRIGFEKLIEEVCPSSIIMYFYSEYESWSKENRERAKELCNKKGINVLEQELSFKEPVESWKTIFSVISEKVKNKSSITLDITTMPRETIWSICDMLGDKKAKIQYSYHEPKDYGEWLSRDPGRPRMVYKLGGICNLGLPTTLMVLTGFDVARTKQLARFYEPENLILGLQEGEQYENIEKNRKPHLNAFKRDKKIIWIDLDCYNLNKTLSVLDDKVAPLVENSNVILSSLGPKISALALYKFHEKYPSTAMSYAPSNEFSKDYSLGYKKTDSDIL